MKNTVNTETEDSLDIARSIRNNYRKLFKKTGEALGCSMYFSQELCWVNNNHTWPNQIYGLNLSEDIDDYMEWIVAGMKSRELPSILTTSVFTKPRDHKALFERYGLEKRKEAYGMAIDLESFDYKDSISGVIEIFEVLEKEPLTWWSKLVMENLMEDQLERLDAFRMGIKAMIESGRIHCFIGFYGGKPVATSMLFISEGCIGGIYNVVTDPDYRNRGFGREMTATALQYAKKQACHVGVIFSESQSKSMFEKIGFKEYTKFGIYELKNMKNDING